MRRTVLLSIAALGALPMAGVAFSQGSDNAIVFRQDGRAAYYGAEFGGKTTASGRRLDQNAMTAAHPRLPLGSEVTVTDPATGRRVEVEITDRGPYSGGLVIDLTQGAAKKLGIMREGGAKVTIEATRQQVRQAIKRPKDAPGVEHQLKEARRASAAAGTPQPALPSPLEPPR